MIIPFDTPRSFRIPHHPSVKPEFIGIEVPVKEAPWPLPVSPTKEDIENAIPVDPYLCMYAVNIRRVWNAVFVAVEHGVMGAVMPDENGKLWFYRWILSAAGKRNIEAFDAGKKFRPHTVKFLTPSPSQTLAAKQLAHVKWELKQEKLKGTGVKKKRSTPSEPRRSAHVKGTKQGLSADQLKEVAIIETLRKSGKGMIQYRPIIAG